MKQIDEYITALVLSVKKEDEFRDCRFVKGFSNLEHENPMCGYMVAVSTFDTQFKDEFLGETYDDSQRLCALDVTVKFRVYANKVDGGDGLLSKSLLLSEKIKQMDSKNVCKDVKVSSIAFDDDAKTVYRDVLTQMSFCMSEEVTR